VPRLVKGGKHVYGWSEVGAAGKIAIPTDALEEYNLNVPCKVILLSGSKRSGGFALTTIDVLKNSHLSAILDASPQLAGFQYPEGKAVTIAGKPCCWVNLNADGCIVVPLETLKEYEVNQGDLLLSVRGSRYALAFCVKGPLIAEAKKHSSLKLFN
jgi:bifunctional DNA-binding transcriptional regulator/antitoxin component of YhaV-PrlF toxin-antitoxin module